jgi:transposase-like protein
MFRSRWPHGFCCPRCGHEEYYWIQTRELYECRECRMQISVTAGTVMHGTKLPLQFWFLAIYIVASGENCSANQLAETLHLNYRTALRMLSLLRHAMRNDNGNHPLSDLFITAINPTRQPSGMTSSSDTATGEHVADCTREHVPDRTHEHPADCNREKVANRNRNKRLNAKYRIYDKNSAKPGDVIMQAKKIMIRKAEAFIRRTYRSISPSKLQSYIDEFYFRWTRRFDVCLFTDLLRICGHPYYLPKFLA